MTADTTHMDDNPDTQTDSASTIATRLADLRSALQQNKVAACLIPSSDPHLSEYLPAHWQARTHFSGFNGSAGTLLVTADFAGLWTDARYFEQATQQLANTGVTLMKLRIQHAPEYIEWLREHLHSGDTLAVTGDCLSLADKRLLHNALATVGAQLRTDLDLPASVWAERPELPCAPVYEHTPEYAITPRSEKLADIRRAMSAAGASHHLVSTLDDVAWITNLRGADINYNPMFLAHLLIDDSGCKLFVDGRKIDTALREKLASEHIETVDYASLSTVLSNLSTDSRVLYDPARVVSAVVDTLPATVTAIEAPNPSIAMKAVRQPAELAHIRDTMRQDGAALVQGFHAIERALANGDVLTELDVERILHDCRAARPGFVSESFATIAGYMANGALPHYKATPAQHSTIAADGLLLVDSGGQYPGGTTDITRVWAFGATTQEQRHDYTLVLKGMIQLSQARFPAGASGQQIDAIARAPIWAAAADYGHGTGHGVGYFLNVHDGPHSIRPPHAGTQLAALEPGMVCSIEPGLYKSGRYGIRHENLVAVRADTENEFGRFLAFETLTLCPFDSRAIDPVQLTADERDWLNTYHARVAQELGPLLDEADHTWLLEKCAPLSC